MLLKALLVGVAHGPPKRAVACLRHDSGAAAPELSEASLLAFCLPLGLDQQHRTERMSPEEFTFALTQGDGSRLHGFCRRFLPPAPPAGGARYAQVLCLVAEAPWAQLYFKVLEVVEALLRAQPELLVDVAAAPVLPAGSHAAAFLDALGAALAQRPALGSVVRVALPALPAPLAVSPARRVGGGADEPLALTPQLLELQVPPDCGNGPANAGVSLARLLWHVPVPALLSLIAGLLLERRVLIVGQSRDVVSGAVAAAAALIYPFRWHHIHLPLLPVGLRDYLTAPMPFLIGLPAALLPGLRALRGMEAATVIDLDLGTCEPAPGSARDDAALLPWREQLAGALHAAYGMLRSPTEHESTPLITSIMQGYCLKLLGGYRAHIWPDGSGPRSAAATPAASPRLPRPGSAGSLQGAGGGAPDDALAGHGHWFDHAGLVASHRHNERARAFLGLLRQSQLYEVWVQERLAMAASVPGGPECSDEAFERLVNAYLDNRSRRLAARLGGGVRSGLSKLGALVKKTHRRTGSFTQQALGGGGGGLSRGLAALADSPEAQRLKQLAAAFASGAGQMRRSLTGGTDLAALSIGGGAPPHGHRRAASAADGLPDGLGGGLDPSAFFDNDEEDELDAADAAAAEAAAAGGGGSARTSRNSSSSSLRDLAGSAASWTAGGAGGSAGASPTGRAGAGQPRGGSAQQPRGEPPALARRSVPAAGGEPRPPSPLIDLREGSASGSRPGGGGFLQQQATLQQAHAQHWRPPLSPSSAAAASHRSAQHLHTRAALASIAPGPLPQPPPPPRTRASGVAPAGLGGPPPPAATAVGQPAAAPAAWDPFAELAAELPGRGATTWRGAAGGGAGSGSGDGAGGGGPADADPFAFLASCCSSFSSSSAGGPPAAAAGGSGASSERGSAAGAAPDPLHFLTGCGDCRGRSGAGSVELVADGSTAAGAAGGGADQGAAPALAPSDEHERLIAAAAAARPKPAQHISRPWPAAPGMRLTSCRACGAHARPRRRGAAPLPARRGRPALLLPAPPGAQPPGAQPSPAAADFLDPFSRVDADVRSDTGSGSADKAPSSSSSGASDADKQRPAAAHFQRDALFVKRVEVQPFQQLDLAERRRVRELKEIVDAAARQGVDRGVIEEGMAKLAALVPGVVVSLDAMKAADWAKVLAAADGVVAVVISLKSTFPGLDVAAVIKRTPKLLLRPAVDVAADARQVKQMLAKAADPDAIISAVPYLLSPRELAQSLSNLEQWFPGEDPLQVLQQRPEVLTNVAEADLDADPTYGMPTNDLSAEWPA
ncbi:DENND2B [Scenedesmus sp. PABB004]|nr:DENND2B [Scenedesmus sp. PABB004]